MKKLFTFYCLAIAMPRRVLSVNDRVAGQKSAYNREIAIMFLNNSDGNIRSLKIDYSLKHEKQGSPLGLRGEQTIAKGVQLSTDSLLNHNYYQLFQSLGFDYDTTKNHICSFTKSRREVHADYAQSNPFKFFVSPTTFRDVNPLLLPRLTYSAEFSHTYKKAYTNSFNFSRRPGMIAPVLLQNNAKRITIQKNKNITISGCQGVDQIQRSFGLYSTNSFTLPKKMSGELSIKYTYSEVRNDSIDKPIRQLSVGVKSQILEKKRNLKVNCTNMDKIFSSKKDITVANIAFNYRFGKSTVTQAERHSLGNTYQKSKADGNNG